MEGAVMSTSVFVPKPFVRRPTFEQVLQASAGSGKLLQPSQADQLVNIPTFLLDGFPIQSAADVESAKKREALYKLNQNNALFQPAENEKKNTEVAMQAFIAEVKANRPKKSWWRDSEKKTYEEDFVTLITKGPQTMDSVVLEIHKTWVAWKERPVKLEAAKRYLLQFSQTVKGYTIVFDLIPNQSLYTSTLCGALKLLINASVSYEAMAEGFARALAEIGQELITAKNLQALYDTEEMTSVVISLYSHIMRFLCYSMKWCRKYGGTRRFLTSFSDGGYWSQVAPLLDPIKTLAQRIKDIAGTAQMAENRDEHVKAEAERKRQSSERVVMYCYFQTLFDQQNQIMNAINDVKAAKSGSKVLNGQIPDGPDGAAASLGSDYDQTVSTSAQTRPSPTVSPKPRANSGIINTDHAKFTVPAILKTAQDRFSDHFPKIDTHHDLSRVQSWRSNLSKEMNVSPQAAGRIAQWFNAKDATILYVRSNIRAQRVINPITALSANIITAAKMARIPTLYFFCGLNLLSRRSEKPAFIILFSMIRQALEWLEESDSHFEQMEADFSEKRFTKALNSAKGLWSLFQDVIGLLPKSPIVVIDLLEAYESYDDEIGRLIERLLTLVPSLDDDEDDDMINDLTDNNDRKNRTAAQDESLEEFGKPNSAYKLLITSKKFSSLLDDELPDEIKIDIRDWKRGYRQRNDPKRWLDLAAMDLGMASSSNEDVMGDSASSSRFKDLSVDDNSEDLDDNVD